MSKKDDDEIYEGQQFTLEEILAEFGNESRDLPQETHPGDQTGVPEEGPDLLPVPDRAQKLREEARLAQQEAAHTPRRLREEEEAPSGEEAPRVETGEDWRDNTIPFPIRPQREPAVTEEEEPADGEDSIPARGEAESVDDLLEEKLAQVFDGLPPSGGAEEPTRVLEFPAPEPSSPLLAGIDRLRKKTDEFASHMYEGEDPDATRRIRRAEQLIPGVDKEEVPAHPVRERKPRKEVPPPPDVHPAELAKRYSKGLTALRARTILVFVVALAMLYLTLAPGLGLFTPIPDPDQAVYVIAAFHLVALGLGYDALSQGLTRTFRGGMGMDTLVVLSNLLSLVHSLTIPSRPEGAPALESFSAVCALSLWGVLLGNLQKQRGQRLCCRAASAVSAPYLVTRDEEKWNGRDTYVKWSGPLAGFGSQVQAPDGAEQIYRVLAPMLLLSANLFALISSVGRGRGGDLLWCLTAILTAASPISATLCFGAPWRRLSVRLTRTGAALAGWKGVVGTTGEANLLLTDTDLFPGGSVSLNGIKVFGDFPEDLVISYTATLIRESGSGLDRLFTDLVRQRGTIYRQGEKFTAYEGGGCSETIRGEQVLVGSAAFMVLMEVPLPAGLKVKNAVFCAIDGELAGIFALNYQLPGAVPEAVDCLIRNKITPVLATRDFNLIPSMLRQRFKLPVDKMEYPPVDRRRELTGEDQTHSDTLAAILCREGLGPFADAVVGGRRLRTAVRLSASLCCLGAAVGVLLSFYLTFVAAYASLTPGNLLVFLLMWLVPTLLISGWVDRY